MEEISVTVLGVVGKLDNRSVRDNDRFGTSIVKKFEFEMPPIGIGIPSMLIFRVKGDRPLILGVIRIRIQMRECLQDFTMY